MCAVGSDGPPASKVRAMRGLPVLPVSISAADTGCTPAGVSQGDDIGGGVGVASCVGVEVGVTTVPSDGVGVAAVLVGVALGLAVAVGPGVGLRPPVLGVPPQPSRSKSTAMPMRSRAAQCL